MEIRSPILTGYDLAIATVQKMHEERTGHARGALAWLADKLGTSRQNVDNWSKRAGFPPRFVPKVARITGLAPGTIRPETVLVEHLVEDWEAAPSFMKARSIVHPMGKKYG